MSSRRSARPGYMSRSACLAAGPAGVSSKRSARGRGCLAGGLTSNGTPAPTCRFARLAVVLGLAACALGVAPAGAATEQHAFAAGMSYATPVVDIGQGDKLTFTNLDQLAQHDI